MKVKFKAAKVKVYEPKRGVVMKAAGWLPKAVLILVGLIAIGVSVADLFGALTNLPWLAERITVIILLLIGLLITFVAFQERDYSRKVNSKVEESTSRLIREIKNLRGVEVLRFENVANLYNYVTTKLSTVNKSVDDITWGSRKGYRTEIEKEAYENYLKAVEAVCQKGTIKYREVSSLTDEHYFQRSMNLITEGHYSYHLGYYDISQNPAPLISYIILDSKEVVLGFYRVPLLPSEGEVYLSIAQPDLVRLFEDYFETLWLGSAKVKEATKVNHDLIYQIKKKLNIEK